MPSQPLPCGLQCPTDRIYAIPMKILRQPFFTFCAVPGSVTTPGAFSNTWSRPLSIYYCPSGNTSLLCDQTWRLFQHLVTPTGPTLSGNTSFALLLLLLLHLRSITSSSSSSSSASPASRTCWLLQTTECTILAFTLGGEGQSNVGDVRVPRAQSYYMCFVIEPSFTTRFEEIVGVKGLALRLIANGAVLSLHGLEKKTTLLLFLGWKWKVISKG